VGADVVGWLSGLSDKSAVVVGVTVDAVGTGRARSEALVAQAEDSKARSRVSAVAGR